MKRLRSTFIQITKRIAYSSLAVLLVMLAPAPYVFADGADPTAASASTSCTPVVATPGIKSPTGSDASTYTFNTCTGLWENQYYTWSPATKDYTPKTPYVYTCNTAQCDWTYTKWIYNPVAGKYVQVPLTTNTLPDGAIIAADSLAVCAPPPPAPVVSEQNTTGGKAVGVAPGATVLNVRVAKPDGSTSLSRVLGASPEDGLRGVFVQVTALAAIRGSAQPLQVDAARHELRRAHARDAIRTKTGR